MSGAVALHGMNFRFPRIETTGVGQYTGALTHFISVKCSAQLAVVGLVGRCARCVPAQLSRDRWGQQCPCWGHWFGCREAMAGRHVALMKCAHCAFREDNTVRSE